MKADVEDPDFMEGMENLLGMDSKQVEKLLDELDADTVMALTDAIAKEDKAAAEDILRSVESEVNSLFRGKDYDHRDDNKKKPKLPPKDYEFAIGDDVAIKTTNEDTGEDDFVSATVYRPHAPGNTIGVKIEGKPQMVDKDEVYMLSEMVLGMTGVPDIQRMQQLAGISAGGPEMGPPPVQMQPLTAMNDMDAVERAMCALDSLEEALPNVRLADLKAIRARITAVQTKMNESILTSQPAGRPKKL